MTTGQKFTLTRTISADGRMVEDQIEGIKGKSCGGVAKIFATVGEDVEHKHTPSYYKPAPISASNENGNHLTVGGGKVW